MTAAWPLLLVLAAVAVAGWHTDRVERRNRWRRLATASALRRSGWTAAAGPDVTGSHLVDVCRCDLFDARRNLRSIGRGRPEPAGVGGPRPRPTTT